MNDLTTKERLKNLIAKSKEERLIKELLLLAKHQPSDVADQIFSLSAAYNKYSEEISYGVLKGESERVVSNDLSRRMLMVINLLELEDIEDKIEEPKTQPTPAPPPITSSRESKPGDSFSVKKIKPINILVLFFVTAGLLFWLVSQNNNDVESFTADTWIGTWTQEIEASQGLTNSGTITFETVDGSLKGKSEMKHTNGSSTIMSLYNIVLDQELKSIQGLWQSADLGAEGAFRFSLKDQSSFNGSYTISPDQETSFFWNGSR